jgi:LmbE family N-acetylglucosaminyl deacetylase
LGCGGTIAKKTSEGYEVFVVIITDGRHAFSKVLGINSDPNPEEIKQIRKEEVIKATRILGVPITNLLFLDFEDRTLEKHEKEAEEKIIEILGKHFPSEVYFPYSRDGHPDHQVVNRIIRRSLQKLGLPSTEYQYCISHKYSRIGPRIERLLSLFTNSIIEVDISEYLDLKRKATNEFKTQISIISSKQKSTVARKVYRFLRDKERFYVTKKDSLSPFGHA